MMVTCTFFGHRDAPTALAPFIEAFLRELTGEHGVTRFLVGNQGQFDAMVTRALVRLKEEFPQITFAVVLAYLPQAEAAPSSVAPQETIFPAGLELVPPVFAIQKRNLWMLGQADCVVTYVTDRFGNAEKFRQRAMKQGKRVWNLADLQQTSGPQISPP